MLLRTNFNTALESYIRAEGKAATKLDDLLVFGLDQFKTHGNCDYLTRIYESVNNRIKTTLRRYALDVTDGLRFDSSDGKFKVVKKSDRTVRECLFSQWKAAEKGEVKVTWNPEKRLDGFIKQAKKHGESELAEKLEMIKDVPLETLLAALMSIEGLKQAA